MYVYRMKFLCSSIIQCCSAMEQFIAASPECVNLKAGHYASTPLHIAATYNYCGIVSLLAEQVNVTAMHPNVKS